ncbi:MAG: hypothetical protein AAF996_02430 [Pseudomonadota bacterium]
MPESHLYHYPTEETKIFADLIGVKTDLEHVINCTRLVIDDQPSLNRAIMDSALIAYRRCFASGMRTKLTDTDVLGAGQGADEFHDYIINQASKHIAHSVNLSEWVKAGLFINAESHEVFGVGYLSVRVHELSKVEIAQLERLANYLANEVVEKQLSSLEKIILSEAQSKSPQDLIANGRVQHVAPDLSKAKRSR